MATRVQYDWRFLPTLMLVMGAVGASARAQDEEEADAEPGLPVARRPLLNDQQFDQQIFGRAESVESARARLRQVLSGQLLRLDRQYRLTDVQRQKLVLAGEGDIKRALDRVDELRRKFQLVKYDRSGAIECLQEARNLRIRLQGGIFEFDSLLAKTIATTITEEQKTNEINLRRREESRRYPNSVAEVVSKLVRVLNLTPDQHQKFKKLLMDEIRPPRRLGDSVYAYIMYQLSTLPEAKVRPIFRDSQWKLLHELLMGWKSARPFLEHDGFVFDDSPTIRSRKVGVPLDQRRAQAGK